MLPSLQWDQLLVCRAYIRSYTPLRRFHSTWKKLENEEFFKCLKITVLIYALSLIMLSGGDCVIQAGQTYYKRYQSCKYKRYKRYFKDNQLQINKASYAPSCIIDWWELNIFFWKGKGYIFYFLFVVQSFWNTFCWIWKIFRGSISFKNCSSLKI